MTTILLILYELVLWLIAILAIPKTLFSFFYHKKYRESLLVRLGFKYPIFQTDSLPSIWIHAVSVGETKAIVPLARELNRRFPNNPLIISSTTETGHAEAKRSLSFADYHVYLPFDFNWVVYRIVKNASPGLVVLSESDFWFNFLFQSKKMGASVALTNGKMSERSMDRFRRIPFFAKRLFGLLDVTCVQNTLYASRLVEAGNSLKKIVVTGNLKLDEDYPQLSHDEVKDWKCKLGIQANQKVLTIGSSHDPEERIFIQVLKEIWKEAPEFRVLLVPRKPEHFKEVGQLLEKERIKWVSFTDIHRRTGNEQVILMDTMGLLRMCYQLSDFALVAGSFTDKVGGHNILEPCWYGKPVLFGPCMRTQLELVEIMKEYGAGIQVKEEELYSILKRWINSPQEAEQMGLKGIHLVKDLKGATQRTLNALEPLLTTLKSN